MIQNPSPISQSNKRRVFGAIWGCTSQVRTGARALFRRMIPKHNIGIPSGMLVDSKGPRLPVLMGAILLFSGYYPIYYGIVHQVHIEWLTNIVHSDGCRKRFNERTRAMFLFLFNWSWELCCLWGGNESGYIPTLTTIVLNHN